MITIIKDDSFAVRNIPFGIAEVRFPAKDQWDGPAFRTLVDRELEQRRAQFPDYERKAVFGEHPYYRFFKKFKKTYPVLLQAESVLFKGRPFPNENPVVELPFLLEICTFVLSGTHDIDYVDGPVTLFTPDAKIPFPGMRGEESHTYPNDICARDNSGIILSMIAGADARTYGRPESNHVFYPIFGTPDTTPEMLESALDRLTSYIRVLASDAQIETAVL